MFNQIVTVYFQPYYSHKIPLPVIMTRNIPKDVRKILRKEVYFGCPIKDCGSPYLSYHHFNPP